MGRFFERAARGRDEATPVRVHNMVFVVVASFVGLLVLVALLVYAFTR